MGTIIQPQDAKYYVKNPDSSFSPARNKAIIDETISETEKFFNTYDKAFTDEVGNRVDILSTYARYRFNTGEKTFKEYTGKKLWTQLVGEKILQKVRVMDTVNKMNKMTGKFSDTILL